MANYKATVSWERGAQLFTDNRYSRAHTWKFDGGLEIPASSSPHVVAVPYSDAAAIDPEEAFIASLSSCHMLWFLAIAAKQGFCVDNYVDIAVGEMKKNASGKTYMAVVALYPQVIFSESKLPSGEKIAAMHKEAHEECFIANSVKTEVRCEPIYGSRV